MSSNKSDRPIELNEYELRLAGRDADHEEQDVPLDPTEARSLRETLMRALRHADARLSRLATDAISRARSCHGLFQQDDFPRLRKAAEVGDAANRLYATALLLALSGALWMPEESAMAA